MAVKNFRIGNDLVVLWAICNRDGSPYNLANKQVRLFVMNERGRKEVVPVLTTLPDGSINNVIRWDFYGMEQRVMGLYTLSVEIFTDEDKKSIKKDYCEAFCLVGSSSLEDEDLADNISDGGELILSSSLDAIQLSIPRIEIGVNGNWIIDGIDTNVSALGGGPGLVNKIYDVLGFGKEYDPTSVIDTFNAYAINSLYGSIKDAEKDIQDAQSSISTLEEDVEYLKTFGGGGSGGSSGGGSISQEQLTAIMEAIGKKADKATTLEGYGIANAYNKAYIDSTLNKYILLSASHQTIKGDITIEGNLIVKGEMASAGVSTDVGGGGSSTLAGLTDVLLGTLNNNDLLSWNGTVWTNVSRSSLTPNLDGYATKTYVTNALVPYATKDNVTSALGGYLPLSGGTINSIDLRALSLNSTSEYDTVMLELLRHGVAKAYFGSNASNGAFVYNYQSNSFIGVKDDGTPHYNGSNTLIHSGNIGSQSVASLIQANVTDLNSVNVGTFFQSSLKPTNLPSGANSYLTGVALATDGNSQYRVMLGIDYSGYLFARAENGGKWNAWKTIAFTDSNVASADYASNAGTLDGLGRTSYFQVDKGEIPSGDIAGIESGAYWVYVNLGDTNPVPSSYSSLVAFGKSYYSPQMCVMHDASRAWLRGVYNTSSGVSASEWHELAFTDSTVAAATRLVDPSGAYMIHLTDYTLYIGDSVYLTRSTNLFGKEIALRYGAGATYGFVLNQYGDVGIGTTSPSAKLHVVGDAIVTGDLASGSDIRFKDIISNTSIDIKDIANAPLFTFKWNDREDDKTHLGTSAQYWESISPELVTGEEFKTLNYASLGVAMGISLAKKVKELEDRVNELETENRRLRYGN